MRQPSRKADRTLENARNRIRFCLLLVCALVHAPANWAGPIAISPTQSLSFGSFVAGSGGSVTVIANPVSRSAGGGVLLLPSGSWSVASFSVTGDPSMTYAISLPANGMVALTSGAHNMAVNNFTSSPASSGQLGGGGSQTLVVGATLSVAADQPNGSYSGSFTVTVDYN